MNLYNIYRALKARKGVYLVRKWLKVNITFGSSLEQMKGRYTGWKVITLLPSRKQHEPHA
jgi:hypothetical protein